MSKFKAVVEKTYTNDNGDELRVLRYETKRRLTLNGTKIEDFPLSESGRTDLLTFSLGMALKLTEQ